MWRVQSPAWQRLLRSEKGWLGFAVVLFMSAIAFIGPRIAPHDPTKQYTYALEERTGTPIGPNKEFLLGADHMGRDEFSRLLYGGTISMQVALFATLIAIIIGMTVGLVSGFFGGVTDAFMMRVIDVFLSIPFLLIAIALHRAMGTPKP